MMAGRRSIIKPEYGDDGNDGMITTSSSRTATLTSLPGNNNDQRTCIVSVTHIPDELDVWQALTQEPGLSEGLVSMTRQEMPREATLVYSAAVYAEALLFRSAKSLNERYGIRLSPSIKQLIAAEGLVKPTPHSPAREILDDDCMILDARPVKKQQLRRGNVLQDTISVLNSLQSTPPSPSAAKREHSPEPPRVSDNVVGDHTFVDCPPSSLQLAEESSSRAPPSSPSSRPRRLRKPTPKVKEYLSRKPNQAFEDTPENFNSGTNHQSVSENYSNSICGLDGSHDKSKVRITHDDAENIVQLHISEKDPFYYDIQYELLICKSCHLACSSGSVYKHLEEHHEDIDLATRLLIDKFRRGLLAHPSLEKARLPFPCPLIPYLKVYHTYLRCAVCRKMYRGHDLEALKEHLYRHFTFSGWTKGDDYDWIITSEFSYTQVFSSPITYVETVPLSAESILGETVESFVTPIFDRPMTKSQQEYLLQKLQQLRSQDIACWFTGPWTSNKSASSFSSRGNYRDAVNNPMDLKIMEVRLVNAGYNCIWHYIEDFKQIVYNSALYNGRQSNYTVIARELEKTFDRQITEALSSKYSACTELAAPILPGSTIYKTGSLTLDMRKYELKLSNSHWKRKSKSPDPETRNFPYSDEDTDEENRRKEADREFQRLTTVHKTTSRSSRPNSARKRKISSTAPVNGDTEEEHRWKETDSKPKQNLGVRRQPRSVAARKAIISPRPYIPKADDDDTDETDLANLTDSLATLTNSIPRSNWTSSSSDQELEDFVENTL